MPLFTIQKCAVESWSPVAMSLPSGLQATMSVEPFQQKRLTARGPSDLQMVALDSFLVGVGTVVIIGAAGLGG